ncbi:MAG: DNA primase, partial [Bryobacteraceae bacterium]|nr:DNA primase [Bryobacteraceae bacterium]
MAMDFAEQVKAQVDIVRTVGEYVKLRRVGSRHVGLCPFHTEKSPSFGVNTAIGIYKCFGCGAAGDVIKFIQEIDNLTFWEALKSLAERNGIPIPQRREQPDSETRLRGAIYEMHETAAVLYAQNLFGPGGADAIQYLKKRGLNSSTAQQFLLGYSEPGWEGLVKRFSRQYSPEEMEKSGLFGKREDGSFYDFFRGRVMFPIHSESAKVIGFGGRALGADDQPKYMNSPDSPIYRKGQVLYNLHRAKDTIRRNDRSVLVEGYMDVIGVFAAGVYNVVASCGTALKSDQARMMKRHSESIIVNFDPDNAGAEATERSIQMLLDEGMHVRVLELDGGLDPDEFIAKYGPETYAARLERASNYFIWLADRARKKFGGQTAEAKMAGYEAMLAPAIRRISDKLGRAAVAAEVADYLGLDRGLVLSEIRKMPGDRRGQPVSAPASKSDMPVRERVLLRSLLQSAEVRAVLLPRLTEFGVTRTFVIWPVLGEIQKLYAEDPEFGYEALESVVTEEAKALLSSALFADHSPDVFTVEQAQGFLSRLEGEELQLGFREVQKAIK